MTTLETVASLNKLLTVDDIPISFTFGSIFLYISLCITIDHSSRYHLQSIDALHISLLKGEQILQH
jgi:hypothetical protein